jgi:hypothetical protein
MTEIPGGFNAMFKSATGVALPHATSFGGFGAASIGGSNADRVVIRCDLCDVGMPDYWVNVKAWVEVRGLANRKLTSNVVCITCAGHLGETAQAACRYCKTSVGIGEMLALQVGGGCRRLYCAPCGNMLKQRMVGRVVETVFPPPAKRQAVREEGGEETEPQVVDAE